jgi:TPR repeat protein
MEKTRQRVRVGGTADMLRLGALGIIALTMATSAWSMDPKAEAALQRNDYAAAVARWQELATRGDVDAALQLGLLYDTGRGVAQNFDEAAHWYRKAADAGSPVAAFNLGSLYDAGRAGQRDPAAAIQWYNIAANHGFGRAANALGVMTENGDGTPRDPAAAALWYRKAVADGVAAARRRLHDLEAASLRPPPVPAAPSPPAPGGQAEFARAVDMWRTYGLDSGNPAAFAALEAAAKGGYPLAQYDLAYSYEHGVGVDADPPRAYAWYRIAENSDGPPALKAAAAVNRERLSGRLSDVDRQAAEQTSTGLPVVHPRGSAQ